MASQTTLRCAVVSSQSQYVDLFAVYYRVYDEEGEIAIASKTSFDKPDTSLGRINMLFLRRLSEEDRTGGDAPEFDELGTDCDRKVKMKSGVAGTWIVGVFLYDRTAQMFPSMDSKF